MKGKAVKKLWSVGMVLILLHSIFVRQTNAQMLNVEQNNTMQQNEWVNWYPANFVLHDEVAEFAEQFADQYPRCDLPSAVHDWICDNIFYDWDAFYEGTYSALQANDVLKEKKAVCEGISNLTQELLIALDIPCIKVWGVAISREDSWDETDLDLNRVNHTWNEYFMDGRWHFVDCTMDMNNRFEDGMFVNVEKEQTFFDPDNSFFSWTHKILYRGDDAPNNVPSEWAKVELSAAMEGCGFNLQYFSDYRASILKSEFCSLFGRASEEMTTITRAEAAELLFQHLNADRSNENVFSDLADCSESAMAAINTLYRLDIMRGTGERTFSPNSRLTRQEAIIVAARLIRNEG